MGGSACHIIIIEGNYAYGVVEDFANKFFHVNTYKLEAAINASCQGILHVSLYFRDEYNKVTKEYTQPILDIHARIVKELSSFEGKDDEAQALVDGLAYELLKATRETVKIFDS